MIPSLEHYATHDESEFPHLWEGIALSLAPCLGVQGPRVLDHSRRSNHGQLVNMDPATDWVIDEGRVCLDFDGINDSVSIPVPAVTYQEITLAAWVKPLGVGENRVRIFDTFPPVPGSAVNSFALKIGTNSPFSDLTAFVNSGVSDLVVNSLPNAVPANLWSHVAATWRSEDRLRIYVNGFQAAASTTTLTGVLPRPSILNIAKLDSFNLFGLQRQDDSFVATRQFSANEIRELWEIGRGGMYTPKKRRPIVIDLASSRRRRLLLMGQP